MMQSNYTNPHLHRLQAQAAARLTNSHAHGGAKRQLLGNKAVPAPAWKANVINNAVNNRNNANGVGVGVGKGKEVGSKILLSRLPTDVTHDEIEELFKKTVGPLKDMFLVYNSQGHSKGMAVITFTRPGDAVVARQKYDGKIVDGRKPIKIEIIYDGVPGSTNATTQSSSAPPSLLTRLGGRIPDVPITPKPTPPLTLQQRTQIAPVPIVPTGPATQTQIVPARRVRVKKGPRRLKKQFAGASGGAAMVKKGPASKDDLDKEMEDYRASAPSIGSV